jgi:5-methylcytosine-specific restriction endonuclease McrA
MKRKSRTTAQRVKIFRDNGGICHLCGGKIDGTKEAWELEHIIPFAMGGADDESNLRPAHKRCHLRKTVSDVAAIAKAKRREANHIGAKASSNPIPGSRNSQWKRKIDGTTVRRGA